MNGKQKELTENYVHMSIHLLIKMLNIKDKEKNNF